MCGQRPDSCFGHTHTDLNNLFYSILTICMHKLNYYKLVTMPVLLLSPRHSSMGEGLPSFIHLGSINHHDEASLISQISAGGEGINNTNYILQRAIFTQSYIKPMLIGHHDGASSVSQLCQGPGEGVTNTRAAPTAGSHFPRGYSSAARKGMVLTNG